MSGFEIGDPIRFDDADNTCFGCSPHNERGLQLEFVRTGPREVECRYETPAHFGGAPGVIHGGVQATILDEVFGVAAHCAFDHDPDAWLVTVEFSLRYRRPAPTGKPIVVWAELERTEGRDIWIRGEIRDEAGKPLTTATARWKRIEPRT